MPTTATAIATTNMPTVAAIENFTAGLSGGQIEALAGKIEAVADLKAAAATKTAFVANNATLAKGAVVTGKTATVATNTAATSVAAATKASAAKASTGALWAGKGLGLGLGLSVGTWLVVAGVGVAGIAAYRYLSEPGDEISNMRKNISAQLHSFASRIA